jgi:hypothetical protein
MTSGDLRDFIDERWSVIQPAVLSAVSKLRVRLEDVTPGEAEWFIASVTSHDGEPPLFSVEDDNRDISDRIPPNVGGGPRETSSSRSPASTAP